MAAVFVPPSPQPALNMTTRRPLANVPNATNSPHRAGLVPGSKRSRTTTAQLDIPFGQPPPKKQVVEALGHDGRSPNRPRATVHGGTDSKLFTRRSNNSQPSAFEKKLVAARDKERQLQQRSGRHEKVTTETMDNIRQWQKHYRKAFPQFVFYFDSIPEEVRNRCSRQVIALGAREEKFFSRLVTHVVTSRPIPPERDYQNPAEPITVTTIDQHSAHGTVQTVNPSLLERNDQRRDQGNMDVLHRARQMQMKIWALEKLQRMLVTINDGDVGGQHGHFARNYHAAGGNGRGRGEADLSQVLRNELLNGPSDRDPLSSIKEVIMFKGPFIYVHDMDEKTRPVMAREYPKVSRRQDGIWPQFRSAPLGKCPFIDEPPTKKELERQKPRHQEKEKKVAPKTRQEHTKQPKVMETLERQTDKPVHAQPQPYTKSQDIQEQVHVSKEPEVQKVPIKQPNSPRKSSESFIPPPMPRTGSFYTGREPAASGMQPSNITSAIRSQMISSTAAAPGAKAGISKEVHELKRKVLEKSNGVFSAGQVPTTDASTLRISKSQGNRLGKVHPHEKPAHAHPEEDTTQSEGNGKQRVSLKKDGAQKKKEERRRDPKPGYCENCRDKFDDFEEHVMTRKHRKFATTASNWQELDALLAQIQRPLKEEYGDL
ncbi:hypothetical protein ASPZODRAFT_153959 [Penicilliopsis zonata CBS 506.65]|uniref:DBF4-type domain-containing protein n=1 Tax=Penicilliopsis zonata CBS 506.65 TaxID=1073090 RepID=A0A1L9S9Z4_9EURO|nr:hypothetical protein ASPZODRAFT_153959 [Penicilliopsis zonata CBS 506.65]OJJ43978.1 hypothetical protein ASPZODRAFT_153959 [Penicilliopsis zonata CBS 506.65]